MALRSSLPRHARPLLRPDARDLCARLFVGNRSARESGVRHGRSQGVDPRADLRGSGEGLFRCLGKTGRARLDPGRAIVGIPGGRHVSARDPGDAARRDHLSAGRAPVRHDGLDSRTVQRDSPPRSLAPARARPRRVSSRSRSSIRSKESSRFWRTSRRGTPRPGGAGRSWRPVSSGCAGCTRHSRRSAIAPRSAGFWRSA